MTEYVCVEVLSHGQIAEAIREQMADGWRLHTYQAAGRESHTTHYLLCERASQGSV